MGFIFVERYKLLGRRFKGLRYMNFMVCVVLCFFRGLLLVGSGFRCFGMTGW